MTVLEIRFPTGRFHATPWGRHVNEGAVEWPPSPWRLLRCLVATWHLKAAQEIPENAVRDLLTNLASHWPRFVLPAASTGHTRHYMPVVEGKKEKTTKIFDTFVQLPPQEALLVAWDLDLPQPQKEALAILAARTGYFGRAESLAEIRLRDDIAEINANALPLPETEELADDKELVRVLTPMPTDSYQKWREEFLTKNGAPAKATGKKKTKKSASLEPPEDLFAALHADTGELQSAGWNLPPGAVYVNYTRPANAFAPNRQAKRLAPGTLPRVARYAVASSVMPRLTRAISVADRVHVALCSDKGGQQPEIFSGMADGFPRVGHKHPFIFCEANGERDEITHLTVWSEEGFDQEACLALRRLNRVWGHGGHDLRLVLIGLGDVTSFDGCQLFGTSRKWQSLTPFVSTRHAKTFRDGRPKIDPQNGWPIGSPAHDLLRLLALNPKTANATVQQAKQITLDKEPQMRTLRCLQFQTIRYHGGGSRGDSPGAAFTLEFPEPVAGPIALGYGCHFGLGLFVPVLDTGQ